MTDQDDRLFLNGINGATGEYLVDPISPTDAANFARHEPGDDDTGSWLQRVWKMMQQPFKGLPMGVDPTDVAQAGWAIVFGPDTSAEIRAAMQPIVDHRRSQVPPDRCLELEYKPGLGLKDWLKSYGTFPGSVAPTKVPYYLLLVGDPTQIPFQFQYLLDMEYAVGRLAFDRPEQYRQYAESVVEYETAAAVPNAREIVYWGARHRGDRATQLSADHLITPLYEGGLEASEPPIADFVSFESRCFKAEDATRANLAEVLHSPRQIPSMLFTASHGMGWPMGHQHQRSAQGALLCQDWAGLGSVQPEHYLTGGDVADDAQVLGMVAFLFACFGAGTPENDCFLGERANVPKQIAEEPFVASLPQRLLSHPNGGALAVIGHIERAWGYSIKPPGVSAQLQPYRNLIGRILSGEPVGHATKDFSDKYAVLSNELLSKLEAIKAGEEVSERELTQLWIERNDAQNYVLLGDPAAKVRVDLLR